MEIFSEDFIFGSFRASDYGLKLGSFSYNGDSEDEIGIVPAAIEEFIGHSPVPVYLGQKYENKLSLTATLFKNPCGDSMYFGEKELRAMLRVITGMRGYQWLKIINYEFDDDIWYRARISNVSYKRAGGRIAGIILAVECDSSFAWSNEHLVTMKVKASQKFYLFNDTDDLNNYVLPILEITPLSGGSVAITNISDNNWISEIKNVSVNEKITINSKKEIIMSDAEHPLLLNDFNLHWIRFVPGKNTYMLNADASLKFRYRVPRKVGFTE